jgi:hypothetical protein
LQIRNIFVEQAILPIARGFRIDVSLRRFILYKPARQSDKMNPESRRNGVSEIGIKTGKRFHK